MKLSTRGRYGTRLMVDLGVHYGEGYIYLKDIAARQEISEKYLWQLIPPLKVAGLIYSARGAKGGYTLAKPPSAITMKDIVTAAEGDICITPCLEDSSYCHRSNTCVTQGLWDDLKNSILKALESTTLGDMVDKQKQKTMAGTYAI